MSGKSCLTSIAHQSSDNLSFSAVVGALTQNTVLRILSIGLEISGPAWLILVAICAIVFVAYMYFEYKKYMKGRMTQSTHGFQKGQMIVCADAA